LCRLNGDRAEVLWRQETANPKKVPKWTDTHVRLLDVDGDGRYEITARRHLATDSHPPAEENVWRWNGSAYAHAPALERQVPGALWVSGDFQKGPERKAIEAALGRTTLTLSAYIDVAGGREGIVNVGTDVAFLVEVPPPKDVLENGGSPEEHLAIVRTITGAPRVLSHGRFDLPSRQQGEPVGSCEALKRDRDLLPTRRNGRARDLLVTWSRGKNDRQGVWVALDEGKIAGFGDHRLFEGSCEPLATFLPR
jgi:hypothetical protein